MDSYKKVIEHFGKEKQIDKAIEEIHELAYELVVHSRSEDNKRRVFEEFCDVHNMLIQLERMFEFDYHKIMAEMERKMERTMKVIEKEKGVQNETL